MPELSIVVPTRDRRAWLLRLLAALAPQVGDVDAEIVVVDDASSDGSGEAAAAAHPSGAVRVIRVEPHGGPAAALNTGIAAARGRFCLFLDDDLVPGPSLVAAHLGAQRATGGCVAIGRIGIDFSRSPDAFARTFAERWTARYDRLAAGIVEPRFVDIFSGNLSAPRAALVEESGFATDLARGFDVELGARLVRRGLAIRYLDGATATQELDKGWRELVRDARREGAGEVAVWRRHPWTLTDLTLGGFGLGSRRVRALRRLALALHLPPGGLARLTPLVGRGRRRRWFELVHSLAFWAGARAELEPAEWRRLTSGVTVLMYHAFGREGEPASRWVLPGRSFGRQLRLLRFLRRNVLDAATLHRLLAEGRPPPPRSVVITIDDGYADALDVAAPLLARAGLPATLFVVADALGGANDWDPGSPLFGRRLLDETGVRAAAAAGLRIGAHGATHRPLDGLEPADLEAETLGARRRLEAVVGQAPATFAYPYGRADPAAQAAVAAAGYLGAFGVRDGATWPGTPRFELRRTEVRGTDRLMRFVIAVLTGSSRVPRRRG